MPPKDDSERQKLYADRWADPDARGALERLVPLNALRFAASRRMADSILLAHGVDSARWGVTYWKDLLRLNVGPAEAMFIASDEIRLLVHVPTAERDGCGDLLRELDATITGVYPSVPESAYVTIPLEPGAGVVASHFAALRAAHDAHVDFASRERINPSTRKGHHPGLVEVIAKASALPLPQPSYVRVAAPVVGPGAEVPTIASTSSSEGRRYEVTITKVERDPRLRDLCLARYGTRCCACGVDLGEAYGPAGAGLIHVHHLHPAAEGERETDAIRDLRPVCPNCHMVIHAGEALRTVEEVGAMCRVARGGQP